MMITSDTFISLYTHVENYPSQPPKLMLPDHLENVGLKEHLSSTAQTLLDSPMLFDLLDSAKEWITSHPLCLQPIPSVKSTQAPSASATQSVCTFYKQGKCKFGDKCHNLHPNSKANEPGVNVAENPVNTQSSVFSQKAAKSKVAVPQSDTQGATNKSKPPSEPAESEKKAPMRPASDVISRILWDPDLPTDKFTVGYLDRFVGIIEKPFTAFSWEDLASVGINVLAVPKHRIQYFKFDGEIVWDKRNQSDNFFGSRGGRVIQDIVQSRQSQKNDSAESASSKGAVTGRGTIKLVEEDDIDENTTQSAKVYNDRDRPTHFVCIHITNPEVMQNADAIQTHIVSHTPELKEGCLPLTALHVTMCMVRLETEQQAEIAKNVLESMKPQLTHILPRCVRIAFTGVDNFRERLVYVKVAKNLALERFVSSLIEKFQLAGLRTPGNHAEYTPHMTLVKLSRPMQRDLRTSIISASTYLPFQDKPVGSQQVDAVHLCSMTEPKQEDGFYKRLVSVPNSLSYHSLLRSLVVNRIHQMKAQEMITHDQETQLLEALNEGEKTSNESVFDFVIDEILKVSLQEAPIVHEQESQSAAQPVVVILRGVSGSGKSFLTQHCTEVVTTPEKVQICSADEYFAKTRGYKFDSTLLPTAHSYCFNLFLTALGNGKELVIIDNTNTMCWEYQIYCYVCEILDLPCHILEIPCPNDTIRDMYQSRNTHNIDRTLYSKVFSRLEEDTEAILVPPWLAYPTVRPIEPPQFSLESLYSPEDHFKQLLASLNSMTTVYTAVFLTEESKWNLVSTFSPTHPKILAEHVTLKFEPTLESIATAGIGRKVALKVAGYANNEKVQAVVVSLPRGLTCDNEHAHITVSTEEDVSPRSSNSMLKSQSCSAVYEPRNITLEGIVGVIVREGNFDDKADVSKMPAVPITSQSDLQVYVMPKVCQGQEIPPLFANVDICTGVQDITQLFIFDFDLTLFNSPDPKEGRELYEMCTGRKWPHKGWLSWPESLLPPLKVYPGPALPEYHLHYSCAGSLTIILTARIQRTEKAVKTILENFKLSPDRLYLRPDSCQQMSPDFKASVVNKLLEEFPNVTLVKFWDDRHDNLAAVQRIARKTTRNIRIEVIDANSMLPVIASKQGKKLNVKSSVLPKTHNSSILEATLAERGLLPSEVYKKAAHSGISFLTNQFCKVIGFEGDPNLICYPFGSFKLDRASDIDLCFVHPEKLSAVECLDKLATQLKSCGVNYIHKGYSSRCPRLKVMLEFTTSPAVEYDIIFAAVSEEFHSHGLSSKEQISPTALTTFTKRCDSVTKNSLLGLCFLNDVQQIVANSSISMSQFGAVVEMVAQILAAHRQKGNAFQCIRTFHVVQLLAECVKSCEEQNEVKDCDTLFKMFISYVTMLSTDKWRKVFGVFVPDEFIPRVAEVFALVNREITSYDFPSQTCYEEMLTRPDFPPKGYTTVELSLSSTDKALLWKLHTIVEARLPSYIRQLLELGLDVVPDGNYNTKIKFCFAVPIAKSSKQTLQQVLRPFWNEITEYRSQANVNIQLNFGTDLPSGKQSAACGQTPSGEVDLAKQLSRFAASTKDKILHLACSLSPYERMIVHETAERLGLQHKSEGEGSTRHIVIRKQGH